MDRTVPYTYPLSVQIIDWLLDAIESIVWSSAGAIVWVEEKFRRADAF